MLLVPELETDTHYFVRIPGTDAKKFFYVSKDNCEWSESGEIFYTTIKREESYDVYNRSGEYIETKGYQQLKYYWDDKTKKEVKTEKEKSLDSKSEKVSSKIDTKSFKNPYCMVYKSRKFLETENGFYFKTNDPKVLIFAIKKICRWNEDGNYIIVEPKKGRFSDTGLSKYSLDGYKKNFEKKLSFKEINDYLKIFYPSPKKKIFCLFQ